MIGDCGSAKKEKTPTKEKQCQKIEQRRPEETRAEPQQSQAATPKPHQNSHALESERGKKHTLMNLLLNTPLMERRPPEPELTEPEGERKPETTRVRSTPTKKTN